MDDNLTTISGRMFKQVFRTRVSFDSQSMAFPQTMRASQFTRPARVVHSVLKMWVGTRTQVNKIYQLLSLVSSSSRKPFICSQSCRVTVEYSTRYRRMVGHGLRVVSHTVRKVENAWIEY